jgi:hypothetical protein
VIHCPACDEPILRNDETIELCSRELAHVRCEHGLTQCVWCEEYTTKLDAIEHWTLDPETGNIYCPASRCQDGLRAERDTRDRDSQAEIDALLDVLRAIKRAEERVPLLEYLRDKTEEALRG